MAEIHPFQGVHYSPHRIGEISEVICPPYDIISPAEQEALYKKSLYNFIRIEFNRAQPGDRLDNTTYTRAGATLEQWLRNGVLTTDLSPALYIHEHYFSYQGHERMRRGIIARVRLEEPGSGVIRPHEGTLAEARSDRLNLLWACQANTSPILALFEDRERRIAGTVGEYLRHEPAFSTGRGNGEHHRIWALTDPGVVEPLCRDFTAKALYIADGHHRYESAVTYRRERLACSPAASTGEPFNFVMMTLVDFADPGLIILPPHRLVRGLSPATMHTLMDKLQGLFDIERLPLDGPDTWRKLEGAAGEVKAVLFGPDREHLLALSLREPAGAGQLMPCFHSEVYKKLEVSLVDHVILGEILGLSNGNHEAALSYSYDRTDAIEKVRAGEFQLTFLLRPIRAETIKAIADSGDRMPKKSTYFYPKAPAGLVLHRLV